MPPRCSARWPANTVHAMTISAEVRLTQYASGGGCACKIPPGELEDVVSRMLTMPGAPAGTGAAGC